MLKNIIRIGNSYGVILDRAVLKLVGADESMHLDLTIEDGAIVLRTLHLKQRQAQIRDVAKRVAARHGALLRKLTK